MSAMDIVRLGFDDLSESNELLEKSLDNLLDDVLFESDGVE